MLKAEFFFFFFFYYKPSGFFLKIFDWGGLKIFGPCRSPTGTKSDGGGTCEKNPTEAKNAHLMQN